jgi:hypothetical protein
MGESLFWRQRPTTRATSRTFRDAVCECPHGQSLGWCDDLHAHALLHTFRRRPRTLAWAKPCLAGRPTMLVRTQCCETNTSRGRRAGMELPDYPVVATLPTPWDQDGPARPLPAGSFPVLVPRSASRRVFSRTRNPFRCPPFFLFLVLVAPLLRRRNTIL